VVEATARETPSLVVAGAENAATELIVDGVNGTIAPSAEPEDLATAILRVLAAGQELRASTARWFGANASRLRLDRSLELVAQEYRDVRVEGSESPPAQTSGPRGTVN
jgi:glycosyltransferase involved in cell wall biosynthesis